MSIAGSDPSGGAGIQADLKTFTAVGVYGCAVITCLTVQNTLGVRSVLPVEPDYVREQIQIVLEDLPVTHVKTGMIGTPENCAAIANALTNFTGEVICDPVLRASDGSPLFDGKNLLQFSDQIVSCATVLTPNMEELELITGQQCNTLQDAVAAAATLFDRFPKLKAVIVKGGHLQPQAAQVTDTLLQRHEQSDRPDSSPKITSVSHPRIQSSNTHGTGCTFAAAFAAFHLLTGDYAISFQQTARFLDTLIQKSASHKIGQGTGPLLHFLNK